VKPAFFADAEFFLQEQVKKVEVAHLVGLGASGEISDGLGEMAQPQSCGGGLDPIGGQLAHWASFAASA
jgi:hypothetical protein